MPANAAIAAELEVLSIAVQELARALAPAQAAQAAQVADAIRKRVAGQATFIEANFKADTAMNTELAAMLGALSIDAHKSDQ